MKRPLLRYSMNYCLLMGAILLWSGCSDIKRLKNETLKPYPNKVEMGIHYRLYHFSKDASTLFIQSPATEYRVTIRVFESFRSKALVYENTTRIFAAANTVQKVLVPIRLQQYALEVLVFNIEANSTYRDAVLVDKSIQCQNLLLVDSQNTPLLKSYGRVGEQIKILTTAGNQEIVIRYFDDVFEPVLPPQFSQKSVFSPLRGSADVIRKKTDEYFTMDKEGLYFIQTDINTKEGIYIRAVADSYPKLTAVDDLTWSVRYITKNEEYKRLTNSENDTKRELDRFWLARTADKDRARNLISTYYNRVQLANEFFTTYKEGWKTDRGIIFTVFGMPTTVQKTATYEYWYYKRTSERDLVEFTFDKVDGLYLLRRSPSYTQPWSAEVFAWRSGRVYE